MSKFPAEGKTGKLYFSIDEACLYQWVNGNYAVVGPVVDPTAFHFKGVSSTDPATGVLTIDGKVLVPTVGDVVFYESREYVYGNSKWNELGDESSKIIDLSSTTYFKDLKSGIYRSTGTIRLYYSKTESYIVNPGAMVEVRSATNSNTTYVTYKITDGDLTRVFTGNFSYNRTTDTYSDNKSWLTPLNSDRILNTVTESQKTSGYYIPSLKLLFDELSKKQNKLTAGANITIENDVISAVATDKHFVYNQLAPSNEWVIEHNLGKHPSVTVVDSAENQVIGEVTYINDSILKVYFGPEISFSGKAYLN